MLSFVFPRDSTSKRCRRCRIAVDQSGSRAICLSCALAEGLTSFTPSLRPQSQKAHSVGELMPGEVLDDYRILREIARGGMGIVYQAYSMTLHRSVALKWPCLRQSSDALVLNGIYREASVGALLKHPNLARFYALNRHRGVPYLVMEYLEGETLQCLADATPLPWQIAVSYLKGVADAVAYTHSQGLIHGDLKPANILIRSRSDRAYLLDFGLAQTVPTDPRSGPLSAGSSADLLGRAFGSPSFASPEQTYEGRVTLTPATDVYSFGATLYFCVTSQAPFLGASSFDTIWKVRHQFPVRPTRWVPGLPKPLEQVCLKCLEKDPERRFRSIDELSSALQEAIQKIPRFRLSDSKQPSKKSCQPNTRSNLFDLRY